MANATPHVDFQVIDWYVHDVLTIKGQQNEDARAHNGGTGRVDRSVNAEYGPYANFTIEAFGLDHEGKTCAATIDGYQPYFYVALPNELTQSKLDQFITGLVPTYIPRKKGDSVPNGRTPSAAPLVFSVKFNKADGETYRISSFILPEARRDDLVIEKCKQVQRFPFYGYQFGKTSPFLKLVFTNEAARKRAARALEKGILVERGIFDSCLHADCKFSSAPLHTFMQFRLFENNVDPLLRFMHERELNACGYISIPRAKFEKNCTTNSTISGTCQWEEVSPATDERNTAPIMMCSYDIEASSSHGDFPIADKGYEKLATELLDIIFLRLYVAECSGWRVSMADAQSQLFEMIRSAFSEDGSKHISRVYTAADDKPSDAEISDMAASILNEMQCGVAKEIYTGDAVKVRIPGRKATEKDEVLEISSYEKRYEAWVKLNKRCPKRNARDKEERLLEMWEHRMQVMYSDEAGLTSDMARYRNNHLGNLPSWKWKTIKPRPIEFCSMCKDEQNDCCSQLVYNNITHSWTAHCIRGHPTHNYNPTTDEIAVYERNKALAESGEQKNSCTLPAHAHTQHYKLKKNGGERRWWQKVSSSVGDSIGIRIEPEGGQYVDYTEMTKPERKRRRTALHAKVSELLNSRFPSVKGDQVIQIGSVFWKYGDDAPCRKHLLTLGTCDEIEGVEVERMDSERELLIRWSQVMRDMSPQLLTGYNIFGFDAKFMWNRADALDCLAEFGYLSTYKSYETTTTHAHHTSGRDGAPTGCDESKSCRCNTSGKLKCKLLSKELNSAGLGDNTLYYMDVPGMVQVDLLKLVMRDHNLSSYKLDDVASHFINGKIKHVVFDADTSTTTVGTDNVYGLAPGDFIRFYKVSIIGEEDVDEGKKFMIRQLGKCEDRGCDEIVVDAPHISLQEDGCTYQWGLAKDDVTPNDIFNAWRSGGTPAKRAEIGKYCVQDSQLVMQLVLKLQVLGNNMGMSSVCSVPLQYIFTRGQGIKTFSLVVRECAKLNTVIPYLQQRPGLPPCDGDAHLLMSALDKEEVTVEKLRELDKFGSSSVTKLTSTGEEETDTTVMEEARDGYQGAFVLDPTPGVYTDDAIAVVDYSSLYPSSIISENLCPSMHIKDPYYLGEEGLKRLQEMNIRTKDVEYDNYIYEQKGKGMTKRLNPTDPRTICRFVQPVRQADNSIRDEDRGILPRILRQVLDQRKLTRKRMKGIKDPFLYNVLEGRQLAYKITANSVYGSLGARTSQIYYKDIAASTTSTGRKLLLLAKDKIEDKFKGSEIVYGDTDSVFINFHPKADDGTPLKGKAALTRTIELGKEAGEHVNQFLEAPHDLEYEKTFWPFILFSKKRYVGNKYEMTDDKFKLSYMGIVLKRRDNAPIVKYMYADVIDTILNKHDIALSMERLRANLTRLERGAFPLEYLIVSKSLRGHYDNPDQIVHKVLADRIAERDPGNKPQSNDRIPYVYIDVGARKVKLQGDRVEHPDFICKHKLRPDYAFYIDKQISKPISQIYALVLESLPGYKHKDDPGFWERQRKIYENDRYKRDADTIQKKMDDDRMKEVHDLIFSEYIGRPKAMAAAAAAASVAIRAVADAEQAVAALPDKFTGPIENFFAVA